MKLILVLIMISSSVFFASCQELKRKAYTLDATVVDQDGKPVVDAIIVGSSDKIVSRNPIPQAEYEREQAKTDIQGNAHITLMRYSEWPSGVLVEKDGYYNTKKTVTWPQMTDGKNCSHAISSIQIKKIKNPVGMYACSNSGSAEKIAKIKQFNTKCGFDLQYAEALPPLGRGKYADFYFTLEGNYESNSEYNMTLKIEFPNKLDGIVEFDTAGRINSRETNIQGSFMQSNYEAPESGYKQTVVKKSWNSKVDTIPQNDNDMKKNYYFRVRTKTDAQGRIVSANYGKIYGDFFLDPANFDWGYYATLMLVDTYFNPTNNDRNVEFDLKKNLLQNSDVKYP